EKFEGAAEGVAFLVGEHAGLDIIARALEAITAAREPEERVQIAQAALPFLDVGFDHVTRGAGARVSFIALRKLRGDEGGVIAIGHLFAETREKFSRKRFIAGDAPRFEQRGLDR